MGVVIQFPKSVIERFLEPEPYPADPEPGVRVSHPKYGPGTVMKAEEWDDGYDGLEFGTVVLTIRFDDERVGVRLIWKDYVQLLERA